MEIGVMFGLTESYKPSSMNLINRNIWVLPPTKNGMTFNENNLETSQSKTQLHPEKFLLMLNEILDNKTSIGL